MNLYLKGLVYKILIDPLLSGLRKSVIRQFTGTERVIDIACGPGSLALEIAEATSSVTGIDLESDLIFYARNRALKRKIKNIQFDVLDASDLSLFKDREFDVAITSMAVHQFEESLAIQILCEMKRISRKVIIADYNYPMETGPAQSLAYGIEKMAGGDHYRNFRNYMAKGGLKYFTDAAVLPVKSSTVSGFGVFQTISSD